MTDAEFLKDFEKQGISRECWTHEAHVRVAWIYLSKYPFEEAMSRIRERIQQLNSVIGARVGYHETITRAYLLLVNQARQEAAGASYDEFKAAHAALLERGLLALDLYYSREWLMTEEAKGTFIEPDRKRLPLAGTVREARAADAEALIEIYRPHIEESSVSFELEVPSAAEMRARIADYSRYGWLVYEIGGKVVGYAYGSPHRARAAYRWCCEVSAYLAPEAQGHGVGALLYRILFDRLRAKGLVNAYAGITLPNDVSAGFHESLGFKPIGVYEKIGFKFGRWHDVGWWSLRLQEPEGEPREPRLGLPA